MRQRVTFQHLPWVDDGFGGNANGEGDWVDLLTTWGNLFPYWQGDEQQANGKLESNNEFKLTIRFRSGFDPEAKYRVKYGTRTFNVIFFRNVNEANKVLEFKLEEVI